MIQPVYNSVWLILNCDFAIQRNMLLLPKISRVQTCVSGNFFFFEQGVSGNLFLSMFENLKIGYCRSKNPIIVNFK